MKLKQFSFTGTHKRAGYKQTFTASAANRREAFSLVQQKYQDFEFSMYTT